MNHRMGKRTLIDIPVTAYTVDRGPISGRLVDLSQSGAGIHCDGCAAFELYYFVELRFEMMSQGKSKQIRVEGFVVRKQDGLIGIMFMRDWLGLVHRLGAEYRNTDPDAKPALGFVRLSR